jgi:hypothetical protein
VTSAKQQYEARKLVRELEEAKATFAELYLRGRSGPAIAGHAPTTDDARMGARIAMTRAGKRDPEIIRMEWYSLIGLRRSIGED